MSRVPRRLLWSTIIALGVTACGGGGGGGSGGTPTTQPPPNPVIVAPEGKDTNTGDGAHPLATITQAAQIVRDGYTIIVAPGTYRQSATTERRGRTEPQALTIIADVTGTRTGRNPGPVIVDASGLGAATVFAVSNSAGTTVDGFEVTGGAGSGIVITSDANNVQIRNCIVHDNASDGIRVQDSSNAVIFNNLVYNNDGSGVVVAGQSLGAQGAHIINNTIFGNRFRGVTVGTSTRASQNAFVRNNIIENSGQTESIRVFPGSELGYNADFNLVRPADYLPSNVSGRHDISSDALFVSPATADFHLRAASPALNAGDSLNGMSELHNFLNDRTSTGGTNCDKGALDLGYHYAPSGRCTAVGS